MIMSAHTLDSASVLMFDGLLDSSTYLPLRDAVIKTALAEPRAVIIDVTELRVPAESAWSVFASARWHVSVWPDVPVVLVSQDSHSREAIVRSGVTRHVPLHTTIESACAEAASRPAPLPCRRARAVLPAAHSSLHRARELLAEWLLTWWQPDLIPVASIVVDVFIENVLEHTQSAPGLVVETRGDTVTIAVEDDSHLPAVRHEDPYHGGDRVSGLAVVAAVARAWGSAPTLTGKTVWAVVGPENCI